LTVAPTRKKAAKPALARAELKPFSTNRNVGRKATVACHVKANRT
jgi:hypothetical protein